RLTFPVGKSNGHAGRGLVRGAVPGQDIRWDAAPAGDLDALLASPCPDLGLVVPWPARPPRRPPGRGHLARCGEVWAQRLSDLLGVLRVQVDLVVGAAKPEPDRALGGAAVNIVYVHDVGSLSH